jgi:hypothetical protein
LFSDEDGAGFDAGPAERQRNGRNIIEAYAVRRHRSLNIDDVASVRL